MHERLIWFYNMMLSNSKQITCNNFLDKWELVRFVLILNNDVIHIYRKINACIGSSALFIMIQNCTQLYNYETINK